MMKSKEEPGSIPQGPVLGIMNHEPKPWALYLDIEGFGKRWNETNMRPFRGIGALMEGIFKIGAKSDDSDRLFAHQFGDAFLVVSDFHEENLDRAVLIGVALMRQVLLEGETVKCSLDEGNLSDIANCFPKCIREQYNKSETGSISMGSGQMTITAVMGSALIQTSSVQKKAKGPLFLLRKELRGRISESFQLRDVKGAELLSLNWIKGDPPGLAELERKVGLRSLNERCRVKLLKRYVGRT
ncbi:MAG: hypothetical protein HC838_15475, partial [Spirulinaceae cyanobacterium RM2_2_10]|nr:hypothetical protein [Spirulinaceae cyanobacterium RM2_2_10]